MATEWIDDEKEELTLRSPDWGKEQKKRWQGNRPCGNVAPTKAASSLHENPLGLEEACWCRSRASKCWNVPRSAPDAGLSVSTVPCTAECLGIPGCMYLPSGVPPALRVYLRCLATLASSVSVPGPAAQVHCTPYTKNRLRSAKKRRTARASRPATASPKTAARVVSSFSPLLCSSRCSLFGPGTNVWAVSSRPTMAACRLAAEEKGKGTEHHPCEFPA